MVNYELKEAIAKRGLKQQFIAKEMNLNPVTFSKKLNGYLHFENDEQRALAKLLSVNIEAIFPYQERK